MYISASVFFYISCAIKCTDNRKNLQKRNS